MMNKELQVRKVQEAHRTSKSIVTRRYIHRVQSPKYPIEEEVVMEHFAEKWAPLTHEFQEADQGLMFCLEERLPPSRSMEMEEHMMDEKHVKEVIGSRADLSACGADAISSRIFKAEK
jgi:hypothetical protein